MSSIDELLEKKRKLERKKGILIEFLIIGACLLFVFVAIYWRHR